MLRSWASFARTGGPGGPGLPSWPRFDGAKAVPHVQSLAPGDDGIGPVDYAAEHHLDFWDGTGPSPSLG
jgi:para-nitrobenzyl esterase